MIAKFQERNAYGNLLLYPVNEAAKTFCALLGTKTFNRGAIKLVLSLGHDVEINTDAVPETYFAVKAA